MTHGRDAQARAFVWNARAGDQVDVRTLEYLRRAACEPGVRIAAGELGDELRLGCEEPGQLTAGFQQQVRHAVDVVVIQSDDAEPDRAFTNSSGCRHALIPFRVASLRRCAGPPRRPTPRFTTILNRLACRIAGCQGELRCPGERPAGLHWPHSASAEHGPEVRLSVGTSARRSRPSASSRSMPSTCSSGHSSWCFSAASAPSKCSSYTR